jgi:hypothetical protein
MTFHFLARFFARRRRSILQLLTAAVLAALLVAPAAAQSDPSDPMQFLLVHGVGGICGTEGHCPDWISAEGQIMADTPRKLRKLLRRLGGRRLPIIVSSRGGDVRAAMEMGYMLRKRKLAIAVGRTRSRSCSVAIPLCDAGKARDGSVKGEVFSLGAVCFSACPLFFAGGTERVASPYALIGVHQITTTYREIRVQYRTEYETVNGRRKVLSKREVGRQFVGKHDTTKLGKAQKARLVGFLEEMGVDRSVFDLMLGTEPSSIHIIEEMDALALRVTTQLASADELVAARDCKAKQSITDCAASSLASPASAFGE